MATVSVIPWMRRDGSVRCEVRTNSFLTNGTMRTHVKVDSPYAFGETLCGAKYAGGVSASGLTSARAVDCEECRTLLSACTFTCEVGVRDASRKEVSDGV